jgi:iron complex transport system substrate-binding protein
VSTIFAILVLGGCTPRSDLRETVQQNNRESQMPQRIISLSPSVTEILFALGLGDRVVGVTRYCDYPHEATAKAKIGGLHDPNFEAIVVSEPDLVIMREASDEALAPFRELELEMLTVSHKSVEGILDSIIAIGRRCAAEEQAEELVANIKGQIAKIEQKTAGLERPRVMFAVERTLGTGRIEDVYVAGRDGFINRIITLAGGRNACQETAAGFPVVSSEGILRMNPEVILDMVPILVQKKHNKETVLADWQQLPELEAVRSGRVYLLDDDYAFIPGPRLVLLAEKLARLIHPEVDWEQ